MILLSLGYYTIKLEISLLESQYESLMPLALSLEALLALLEDNIDDCPAPLVDYLSKSLLREINSSAS